MARLSPEQRLAREKAKFEKTKARLQSLEARIKKSKDKDLTRAKILLGWWVIETWKSLSEKEVNERLSTVLSVLKKERDIEVVKKVIGDDLGLTKKGA